MPAREPEEIHELFQTAFNAADVDALLALYEENGVLVTGADTLAQGHAAIAGALQTFFAIKPRMKLDTASVVRGADLALLEGRWVVMGTDPDGNLIQITGTSREVVRRQPDGSWLYAVDDPGTGR